MIGSVPLHPVVVHLVVVLAALAAIGMIISVFSPNWSRRYASASVTLAGIAMVAAFLSKVSGESLPVQASAEHVSGGTVLPWIMLVFFVCSLVFWLFDRGIPLNRKRPMWLRLFSALVVITAVAASYQSIVVGYSGVLSVWG